MSKRTDQMRLGAFLLSTGHHAAAWRHPRAQADAGRNLAHYIALARTAEAACFDMMFLADTQGGFFDRRDPVAARGAAQAAAFEPITLLSAIASHTTRLGVVATATTTFYEPFILARQFASLDLLSDGRAGWNVVTSQSPWEAANFGRQLMPEPEDRYARAEEFVDVVRGLWESWEDDAFPRDKASGTFLDPEKLHVLDHAGAQFSVAGPLNVPRSPQGHPVVIQAGSSGPGRALAARTADIVFTAHEGLASAQDFYADLKARVRAAGREADALKIMPGIFPVIGGTEAEARAKFDELGRLIDPIMPQRFVAGMFGRPDLLDHPIDEPLDASVVVDGRASRQALMLKIARDGNLTVRELYLRFAGARGHHMVFGTPEQVADRLEQWFDGHAADGFNIMPPHLPDGLEDFATQVVPLLQRRGRFRTEYEGTTLRANLGLPYPVHPAARRRASWPGPGPASAEMRLTAPGVAAPVS